MSARRVALTLMATGAVLAAVVLAAVDARGRDAVSESRYLNPAAGVHVGGRITSEDVAAIRKAGVREVIDLTPDAETPAFDEAAHVTAAGLRYRNLPLAGPSDLTLENVRAFDALLQQAAHPVLVHCASGNRVGAMAALRAGWVEGQGVEDALAIGRKWGVGGLEGRVRELLESGPAPGASTPH